MNVLETSSLGKRYGRIEAVRGLDLAVPHGSIYGLLGPNGSGKTTTLAMALGAVRPDAGTIDWFGVPADTNARRRIGALLEMPAPYPALSGEQNLAITAAIRHHHPDDIPSVLERVGLRERAASRVATYSLGMRQRLALASVLLGNPDVLVLDEPTNGLDPRGIADVRRLVLEAGRAGATVIMASHVLSEVARVCTHVAIMKRGALLASGPIADVLHADPQAQGTNLGDTILRLVGDDPPA
jgi:ABC-2 type transport system ATP-binding protein